MSLKIIDTKGLKDLSSELLDENNKLKLFPSSYYKNLKWDEFRMFCHNKARYGIPTTEMIEFLKPIINSQKTIEIGAGHGDLGYHLGIHMTDSKLQNRPDVKLQFLFMDQPTIEYPDDVEEMSYEIAILTHQPKIVIASWITPFKNDDDKHKGSIYGIKELNILNDFPFVEKYILIGNIDTHGDKPIMKLPHKEYKFDWIVSRAKNQENNRIWIWNK